MCVCLPIKGYYSMSPCDDGYVSVYLYFLSPCLLSLSQSVFLFISQRAAIFPAFSLVMNTNCVVYEEPENVQGLEILHGEWNRCSG